MGKKTPGDKRKVSLIRFKQSPLRMRAAQKRDIRTQFGALCYRIQNEEVQVLLVTSRTSRRWIIPKGWPVRGLKSNEAALKEAWEEAGVKQGNAENRPEGSYTYQKRLESGWSFPVETLVYSVEVNEMSDEYPEREERTRKWVSADEAAEMVDEPELQQIFRDQVN